MRLTRKVMALAMASTMAVSLTACGGGKAAETTAADVYKRQVSGSFVSAADRGHCTEIPDSSGNDPLWKWGGGSDFSGSIGRAAEKGPGAFPVLF